MTTPKKRTARTTPATKSARPRTTAPRKRTTRRRTAARRRSPSVASSVGAALGAIVVAFVLDLSWPARIGLLLLVLVLALGYVVWSHRSEIAASAQTPGSPTDPTSDPRSQGQP